MADRDLSIALRIAADASGVRAGVAAARGSLDSLAGGLENIRRLVVGAFSAAAIASGAREVVRIADAYNQLGARVRLVTSSQREAQQAQQALLDIANRTQSPLAATVDLYSKMAPALARMGQSALQAAGLTETVAQAIRLAGGTAASAEAAILQFGQALGSGRLQGDELRSLFENAQPLVQAIADGLGVTTDKLRAMGEAGEVTSTKIVAALTKQRGAIAEQFAQLPQTVGGALTRINNALTEFVGRADASLGASGRLAAGLNAIASNFDALATAAVSGGGALLAILGGRSVAALGAAAATSVAAAAGAGATAQAQLAAANATLANVTAHRQLIITMEGFTAAAARESAALAAQAAAQAAVARTSAGAVAVSALGTGLSRVLALLGGPVGIIASLAIAAAAWIKFGGNGAEALQTLIDKQRELAKLQGVKPTEAAGDATGLAELRTLEKQLEKRQQLVRVLREQLATPEGRRGGEDGLKRLRAAEEDLAIAEEIVARKRKDQAADDIELTRLVNDRAKAQRELNGLQARVTEGLGTELKPLEATREAIEKQVKIVDALRDAWQRTREEAKGAREEAGQQRDKQASVGADTQAKIDAIRQRGVPPEQLQGLIGRQSTDAQLAAESALNKAVLAQAQGRQKDAARFFDQAEKLAQRSQDLGEKLDDAGAAERRVQDSGELLQKIAGKRAEGADAQANQLDAQAEKQATLLQQLEARLGELQKKAARLEIDADITAAEQKIASLQARIDELAKKGAAVVIGTGAPAVGDGLTQLPLPDVQGRTLFVQRATGGPIEGPGHDTSDNILALLSPNEWVIRARAARHYGPAFMAAVNDMRLPRFADGGLVARAIDRLPRVAGGGAGGSTGTPVNIHLPSGERFALQADAGNADALQRALRRQALKTGVRK